MWSQSKGEVYAKDGICDEMGLEKMGVQREV
jgi:hypothetical protein